MANQPFSGTCFFSLGEKAWLLAMNLLAGFTSSSSLSSLVAQLLWQEPDPNDGPLGSTPEMVSLGAFPPRE